MPDSTTVSSPAGARRSGKPPARTKIAINGFTYARALAMTGQQLDGRSMGSSIDIIAYGATGGLLYGKLHESYRKLRLDPLSNRFEPDLLFGQQLTAEFTGNWRLRRDTDLTVAGSLARSKWIFIATAAELELGAVSDPIERGRRAMNAREAASPRPHRSGAASDNPFADLFQEAFEGFLGGSAGSRGTATGSSVSLGQEAREALDALDLTLLPGSHAELNTAWKRKLGTCHPDHHGAAATSTAAEANAARDILRRLIPA